MALSQQKFAPRSAFPKLAILIVTALAATLLAGCGLFGGAEESPTPMPRRTPLPTFTATPAVSLTPVAAASTPAAPAVADTQPLTQSEVLSESVQVAPAAAAAPAPAAVISATLTIASDLVNVRSGPGTEYELVGAAATGESFAVVAKDAAGDWWEICCVGGQNGWVFGELATVQILKMWWRRTCRLRRGVSANYRACGRCCPGAGSSRGRRQPQRLPRRRPRQLPRRPRLHPMTRGHRARAISIPTHSTRSCSSRCWARREQRRHRDSSAQHLIF